MQAVLRVEQALLGGAPERGAVGVGGAEVGVPGVEVRVEVQHGDPPVRRGAASAAAAMRSCGRRRWTAACAALAQARRRARWPDRVLEVERVDREVAGVRHLLGGERRHVQRGVVGPQQLRRRPDVRGAEAGARAGRTHRSRRARRRPRHRRARPRPRAAAGRTWRGRRTAGRRWHRPGRSWRITAAPRDAFSGAPQESRSAGPAQEGRCGESRTIRFATSSRGGRDADRRRARRRPALRLKWWPGTPASTGWSRPRRSRS